MPTEKAAAPPAPPVASAMTTAIQAIETVYKGYKFRSRLEARWAVVLDELKIKWQYESEGFDLEGTRYLPDFWHGQSGS